jgi:hypothetical protein
MGLNANKKQANAERVAQPDLVGVFPARLVQLIDLGLQAQREYKGKAKDPVQEIMLTYELVDEFMKDKDGNDVEDKPRWVSETLPFYGLFADKAKSTQRYLAFDPKQEFEGDFSQCVGLPINVTLVSNQVGEKTYTNIAAIAAMRPKEAAACEDLKNPSKVFDLDDPDMEIFNALPEWIQYKIKSNLNFKSSPLEAKLGGVKEEKPKAAPKERKAPEPQAEDAEDDNPY